MNANIHAIRRLFLLPLTSTCAACVGLATPAIAQSNPEDNTNVKVSEYDTVDLAVDGADLSQVLQLLSMESKKNIITSKSVSATVTAQLYDVTFYEALDAILTVNGYTYVEKGNFIYVYTIEEAEQMIQDGRKLISRIIKLDHLPASAAEEMVTDMLSDNGSVTAFGDVELGFEPSSSDGGADTWAYVVQLVVRDYEENLDEIEALLDELDVPPDQVLVEATILQTTVDEANSFGVDFTILANMNFTDIVAPLSAVNNLLNGSDSTDGFQPPNNQAFAGNSRVGGTAGPAGAKIGIVTDDISVFLKVLDEVTDSTVLARPKIMVLNRQRAEVLVGARVGYLSSTATETSTTQTVEFLDTGVQLVLRPFISSNGTIRMELRPSVSEASLRTVTDSGGGQVTIPDELTNEVTTNVRVRDGQTLVLGGLFREATQVTRRQIPILGDIPILGAAFRGQDDSVERSEIIFLITPTITHDQTLWEQGDAALAMAELARVGARNGLLPFSQDKMVATYNNNAVAAANSGDVDLALYYIRNSLRLKPQQNTILNLRQQLTGDMVKPYEHSTLERLFKRSKFEIKAGSGSAANTPKNRFDKDPLFGLNQAEIRPAHIAQNQGNDNTNITANNSFNTAPQQNNDQSDTAATFDDGTTEASVGYDKFNYNFHPISSEEEATTSLDSAMEEYETEEAYEDYSSTDNDISSTEWNEHVEFDGMNYWYVSRNSPAGNWWFMPYFVPYSPTAPNESTPGESVADLGKISDVLTTLSAQSGREIVIDPSVTGTTAGNVQGKSFYEALDQITAENGYAYMEIGDVVYVYAPEDEEGYGIGRSNSKETGLAEVTSNEGE